MCGKDDAAVSGAIASAKKGSLADSENFSKDLGDLGEDGIATMWGDLAKAKDVFVPFVKSMGVPGASLDESQLDKAAGRFTMALRFAGPHLELVGRATALPPESQFKGAAGQTGVAELPESTLAAVGLSGADEYLKTLWPQAEKAAKDAGGAAEFEQQLAAIESQFGLSLPDDLYKAVGKQLTVAFGGMEGGEPKVALVTGGDKAAAGKLADAAGTMLMGSPSGVIRTEANGKQVLSISKSYADELAKGGKSLKDSTLFTDAVPNADKAQSVVFVDIAGLVDAFGTEMSAEDRKDFGALSALGVSASMNGDTGDFTLRLSTK